MNVGFISLGCSKNLVDTEMTIGLFKKNNFKIVNNPEQADIIVINTCGFIESAKQEAINTILEMAEYKKNKCKYLIVMGCLVQRYKEELQEAIPEVDLFIKYKEYDTIWEQIEKVIGKNEKEESKNIAKKELLTNKCGLEFSNRIISTGRNFAYLRIAEGCSNRCTYCAIPYIRGKFVSRKMEDILKEAQELVNEGYKEIIVIAQDTSKYGIDIYGESKLAELLDKLSKIEGIKWIRFLYTYPESITDELIKVVKENKKICKYFDIPIQHISDTVLKRMNRKSNGESIRKLITKIRKEIPNVIIRTTVMVGFPGETKENFEELYEFVKWAKFDRLGAFTYSKEDGTPAEKLDNQIHPMTKKSRYNKIMSLQQQISDENLKKQIGNKLEVLIEDESFDGKYYIARSENEVPDIDGIIYVEKSEDELLDKFVKVEIIGNKDYDMIGKLIK
nr:30S ribosomal protein S12 methylthiotransferase RimO [Clostridia bacterium]